MKYIVVSDLVGKPGDEFIPEEGTNVEALLDGGFIKADNKKAKESSED
jgi:hypothetical protein